MDAKPFIYPPAPPRLRYADIALLLFAMALPTLSTWLYFIVLSGKSLMGPAYTVLKAVQFSIPALWMLWVLRIPLRRAATDRESRRLGIAMLFGVGASVLILLLYWLWLRDAAAFAAFPTRLDEKLRGLGANTPLRFAILGLFISIIHSWLEEYYWRWYVYGRLRSYFSWSVAALISALGFTAHHVLVVAAYVGWEHWPYVMLLSSGVAAGGFMWAYLYERTGTLIGPWLSHLLVDVALILVGAHIAGFI